MIKGTEEGVDTETILERGAEVGSTRGEAANLRRTANREGLKSAVGASDPALLQQAGIVGTDTVRETGKQEIMMFIIAKTQFVPVLAHREL